MRILLVEDEPDLGAAIKRSLNHEAYIVDWVQNSTEAEWYLESKQNEYSNSDRALLLLNLSSLLSLKRPQHLYF